MPNRIIKESICTSPTVDELTDREEAFFMRILVNCDDFGRMEAHPMVLLSKCYPLRVRRLDVQDIADMLDSLIRAHLVMVYVAEDRHYLQVITWEKHQRIRAKHSKYPAPDSICQQLTADCGHLTADDSICQQLTADCGHLTADVAARAESYSKSKSKSYSSSKSTRACSAAEEDGGEEERGGPREEEERGEDGGGGTGPNPDPGAIVVAGLPLSQHTFESLSNLSLSARSPRIKDAATTVLRQKASANKAKEKTPAQRDAERAERDRLAAEEQQRRLEYADIPPEERKRQILEARERLQSEGGIR